MNGCSATYIHNHLLFNVGRATGQVEAELHGVSMSFAKLHGRGELTLDLYGRGPAQAGVHIDNQAGVERPEMSGMQRKSRLRWAHAHARVGDRSVGQAHRGWRQRAACRIWVVMSMSDGSLPS